MQRISTLLSLVACLFIVDAARLTPNIFDRFNLAQQYTMLSTADNTVFVDGFPSVPGNGGVIQDPNNKRGYYNLGVGGISLIFENQTFIYFPDQNNTCYTIPLGYDAQTEAYSNAGYTGYYVTPKFGLTFSYAGLVYDISVCGELAAIQMDVDANTGALLKYAFYQPFPSATLPEFPGIEYPPIVTTGLVMAADMATAALPSNIEDYFAVPPTCNAAPLWCDRFNPSGKRTTGEINPKIKSSLKAL